MATNGNNIVLSVQSGTSWVAIAATKSDKIQMNGEMIEIADANDEKYRHYKMGRLSWALNIGWLFTQVADLRKVLLVGTRVKVRIGASTWSASTGLEGYAYIQQCECGATINSLATGAFVLQGDGPLT